MVIEISGSGVNYPVVGVKMGTEISGTGFDYPVVGQAVSTGAQRTGEATNAVASPISTAVGESQTLHGTPVTGAFAKLQEQQDALGKAASVVRGVGRSLNQAGQLLDKMGQGLGDIVKLYPPYPSGNPPRIAALDKITGLRNLIEKITFPPAETLNNVGHLLGHQKDEDGKGGSVLATQDVASVVKGGVRDLPNLDPRSASDAEVSKALGQVKSIQSTLKGISTGIWSEVASYVKQVDPPEAQQQGAETRGQLARLAGLGIGSNGHLLEQVAELK